MSERFRVRFGLFYSLDFANVLPACKAVLVAFERVFDLLLILFGVGHAVTAEDFDAVVLRRVVRGRDHDAGVCIHLLCEKSQYWGGRYSDADHACSA